MVGLGNAYYDTKNSRKAIAYYRKALALDEKLGDVHYNLANALYLSGEVTDSIQHYKQATILNPKKSEGFYNLGNALSAKQDFVGAV